jgi:lysophospholipase L1-like esterase
MQRIAAGLAVATVMLAAGVAGSAPALAASNGGRPEINVSSYYLSLGDSLAQGVQPDAQGVSVETNEGYPDQLYTGLSQTNPYLRLVKLGCPGETTATMIHGGICTYQQGSQLAQAVEFLNKHAGQVPLVTIDIGANDLNPCLVLTSLPKIVACLEKVIPQALTNLGQIMSELRAADPAPGAIIGMSYYDPLLANWLKGTKADRTLATDSVTLAGLYDKDLAGVYKKFGAPTANVFGAFRTTDFTDMVTTPEFGTIPLNVATLCSYTWECAVPPVGPNEHANVLGYGVIANAFFNAYLKLGNAGRQFPAMTG